MLSYLLFLLATAALYVRPAELFPALGNLQIYMPLITAAVLCNVQGLFTQLSRRTLVQQPVNLCVLAVIVAVPVSHLTATTDLSTAAKSFAAMCKYGLYYLMLVSVINTPARLRQLMMVTALCATVGVAASTLDFRNFCAQWSDTDAVLEQLRKDALVPESERVLKHAVEYHGANAVGDATLRYRMRGLGIFSDPNDVALLIAMAATIVCYFLTDRSLGLLRLLWLVPLGILGYGYLQTQSRGGLLAIGAAGMVWLSVRHGKTIAVLLGTFGLLSAPLVLGRAGDLDVSSGSGQERIQIWTEGLMALRSSKFLFGIGEGQIVEMTGLVAHNSYVHAFVELGFVGGTFFFGCFFLTAWALFRIHLGEHRLLSPELRRMLPYIAAIMTAWCVGMLSLSRCYAPSTYMVVGLGAAYVNLAGYYRRRPQAVVEFNGPTIQRLTACSFGLLLACFAAVKVLARFGG